MKVLASVLLVFFAAIRAESLVSAQEPQNKQESASSKQSAVSLSPPNKTETFIELVGGGRLEVDELRETSDGIWYKRGGVTTLLDPKRVVRIERTSSTLSQPTRVAAEDSLQWSLSDSKKVEEFFLSKFRRSLPISAFGQSDIHDRWGLDHRQGLDVGLHPDSEEGIALVEFLRAERIPFLVFRHAVPRVATGPHIHVGWPSHRNAPR